MKKKLKNLIRSHVGRGDKPMITIRIRIVENKAFRLFMRVVWRFMKCLASRRAVCRKLF